MEVNNLLIVVNSGPDKPYNHYASYVIAFMAKLQNGIENVTVFYGPQGVEMVQKGFLANLTIQPETKNLIANQLGIDAAGIPDNLEQMARFLVDRGVVVASCATFHVIRGFATSTMDKTNIEDFVTPVKLPDAVGALLAADRVHYL